MKKKNAFTLAEVLIALVIIGVIAAMTIPSLLQSTNAQEYKTALKKSIAVLNQAITLQYALDGTMISDGTYDTPANLVTRLMSQRLNVIKSLACPAGWAKTAGAEQCVYTADGIMYGFADKTTCDAGGTTVCFKVYVDVNGDKNPNIKSSLTSIRDGFELDMYAQKVIPVANSVEEEIMYGKHN